MVQQAANMYSNATVASKGISQGLLALFLVLLVVMPALAQVLPQQPSPPTQSPGQPQPPAQTPAQPSQSPTQPGPPSQTPPQPTQPPVQPLYQPPAQTPAVSELPEASTDTLYAVVIVIIFIIGGVWHYKKPKQPQAMHKPKRK